MGSAEIVLDSMFPGVVWGSIGAANHAKTGFQSMPKIAVERPVLDRFQDLRGTNIFAFGEIGNRACDLENAIVSPGA